MTTTDDVLGKPVIDSSGKRVGVATTIHFDLESNNITGLSVDQGFGSGFCYVPIQTVELFGKDVIFLNKKAITQLVGRKVYSPEGVFLGVVDHVKTDDPSLFIVKKDGEKNTYSHKEIVEEADTLILNP